MVERTSQTITLAPSSLAIVYEMSGDRDTFPDNDIEDIIEDNIEVSVSTSIEEPSFDGMGTDEGLQVTFDYAVRTRSNVLIQEWIEGIERVIRQETGTDHTVVDWRIESI
jgi:hypothetical protein